MRKRTKRRSWNEFHLSYFVIQSTFSWKKKERKEDTHTHRMNERMNESKNGRVAVAGSKCFVLNMAGMCKALVCFIKRFMYKHTNRFPKIYTHKHTHFSFIYTHTYTVTQGNSRRKRRHWVTVSARIFTNKWEKGIKHRSTHTHTHLHSTLKFHVHCMLCGEWRAKMGKNESETNGTRARAQQTHSVYTQQQKRKSNWARA